MPISYPKRETRILLGVLLVVVIVAVAVWLRSGRSGTSENPATSPENAAIVTLTPTPEPSLVLSPNPTSSSSETPQTAAPSGDEALRLYQNKEYSAAAAKYGEYILHETDPLKKSDHYNQQGNAYRDNNQLDQAVSSYRSAISNNPHNVEPYRNVAAVYVRQNKEDEARTTLQSGLSANPNNAQLQNALDSLDIPTTAADNER